MPHPASVQYLIQEFARLPGIGFKTAERFVYYLLKQPDGDLQRFARALEALKVDLSLCSICYQISERNPCGICTDQKRSNELICVVADSPEVAAIEKTASFDGVYHVLGGVVNQIEGIGPEQLRVNELMERAKEAKEIILALNPDLEGETTSLYLAQRLRDAGIRVTRLARGLPMGSDIEYADEVTLTNALKGRREL